MGPFCEEFAPSLSVKDSFISRLEFKEIRIKYEQPVLRFKPVLCVVVLSAGDDFALMLSMLYLG